MRTVYRLTLTNARTGEPAHEYATAVTPLTDHAAAMCTRLGATLVWHGGEGRTATIRQHTTTVASLVIDEITLDEFLAAMKVGV